MYNYPDIGMDVRREVYNGKTYNVYVPRDQTPTPYGRWHDVWLEHLNKSKGVYPYGVSTDDVRYGSFHRFNGITVALAVIYKSLYTPKAYVDIYRTKMRKQWEPFSDYDLLVFGHRSARRCLQTIDLEKWYGL